MASKADVTVELRDGVISGFHQAGIDLDMLDTTRIVRLDDKHRLPMPTDLLDLAGSPREFRLSYVDDKFILVPQTGEVVDQMREKKTRTCRVCGSEIPAGKFICSNCGSQVTV